MSVVPDLLLQPAAKPKSRAAPAKAPAAAPEPAQRKAASFAQVYARERQDKPVERAEPTAKATRESAVDSDDQTRIAAQPQAGQEAVAASGKALPDDTQSVAANDDDAEPQTDLDPLLMLGLGAQLPIEAPVTPTGAGGGVEVSSTLASPLVAGLVGAGVAANSDAGQDQTLEELASAANVQLTLEQGVKAQAAGQKGAAATAQGAVSTAENFAGVLSAMSGQPNTEGKLGEGLAAELKMLESDGVSSLKDASPELRADNLTARLSALNQAIGQQTPAASRLSMIPGQPLAMQQGGWSEAVVDKVMWLSSQNLKSAQIQLDPVDLGRLEVRVDIAKDQTHVTFASPHAGVREALEGQMQRLRDLFIEQGMNLLDVNVSDQSMNRGWQGQGQGDGDGQQRGTGTGSSLAGGDDEQVIGVSELRAGGSASALSLVDYYA
jgi:flagellar hook-length control protein FliK